MAVHISNRLFGTSPIAAHCPGPLHARWHRFVEAVLSQRPRECKHPDVTLFTWNSGPRPSRPNKPCGVLEQSLQLLGVPVLVLGQGRKNWKNRDKFACAAEALADVKTPYVIGADSADVVFLDNPQIAVETFRRHFTCPLVFNATGSRCWPELPELVRFQSSLPMAALTQGRHWINSGLLIGETQFTREYFAQLAQAPSVPGYEGSDQAVVMQTWPDWYPRVQADYLCQMFQWFNEDPAVMRLERSVASRQVQLLDWLRTLPGPIMMAEIGVFHGFTSEVLLRELPGLKLWMIDPWRPYEGESSIGSQNQAAFDRAMETALGWTEFAQDRRFVLREPSRIAAPRFADGSLDAVFIDGNHLYEEVCADIRAWWPKVRRGGLLTGHDYAAKQDADGPWGVQQAVDGFISAAERDLLLGRDGTWCVRK